MVAVGDERRASQSLPRPQPDDRGRLVPGDADEPGDRQRPQVGEIAGLDQSLDRCREGNRRADRDCDDDRATRPTLAPRAPQEERDPDRDRGQRIPGVVDQVGEERDCRSARR